MRIKCSKCEKTSDVNECLEREWAYVDGHKLYVTYFVCEHCNTAHIVQLDDDQTLMCLDEVSRKMKRVGECKVKGKTPKKRTVNGMKKKNKELSKMRKFLVDMHSGKDKAVILNGMLVPLNVEMQEYVEGE